MREMSVTEQRDKAVLKIAGCTYRAVDNALVLVSFAFATPPPR